MLNYNNQTCDVCHKPFDKDSDIVVCPVCGTPHHRQCWNEIGHCVNESKHAEGFEWKEAPVAVPADSVKCAQCGTINPKDSLFCENCGKSLSAAAEKSPLDISVPENVPSFMGVSREEMNARVERELGGESDGVPYKDMAVYIGPSAQYYIFKFKRMQKDPKYKPFCWTACLFSPLYFLYRKMWKLAGISALVNFVLNMPTTILMMSESGVIASSSPLLFSGINTVAAVCNVLVILAGIVFGFMAVPAFKKRVIGDLSAMKSMSDSQESYYRTVLANAGPSKFGLAIIILFTLTYIFYLLF